MADMIMSDQRLKNNVDNIVVDFVQNSRDDTSLIVAGMVSIIKGNEADLERMKNQRWFERIWYTISGKNKATVAEMRSRRDELNKYLIMIINRLLNQSSIVESQTMELSSAILSLDDEFREMKISVDKIARALNDKILSLDTYDFIKDEIRNNKFPADQPLLSLIDIMSQLDNRTVNDRRRLQQLKETMENSGFSFDTRVSAREYAKQVLSLPKEKAGRILLFCQNFSQVSKFLAYTCNLIENFFYLSATDRDLVEDSPNSTINASLCASNLDDDSACRLDSMYTDLTDEISNGFSRLSEMAKSLKISAYIVGKSSSGKDDLCCVLDKEYENFTVKSIDFDVGSGTKNEENQRIIKRSVEDQKMNCVIYCVDAMLGRFEEREAAFLKDISNAFPKPKIAVALTNCVNNSGSREFSDYIRSKTALEPICVLAKDRVFDDDRIIHAFGVDELVERVQWQ